MTQLIPLQFIPYPGHGDLAVAQAGKHVPFSFTRVFLLCDVPAHVTRGDHAHRQQHQMLIAVSGKFRVATKDAKGEESFVLDKPSLGLHLPPLTWVTIRSALAGSNCLVLASADFDEADYIRDREEFDRLIRG